MDTTQTNVSAVQMLGTTTCKEIDDFIKDLNASEYESRNMTIDEYLDFVRSPHCRPIPYPIPQGLEKWLATILMILFLFFGLIGNSLSAIIMFRRSRRGLSSYFYLAILAIIDICILYTSCLLYLFEITFNYYPQLHSNLVCRLAFYIQHLFTYISAWLLVAVTFERLMVVRFPFQSIRICRMRVAYTITMIIFGFFSLYSINYFFTTEIFSINLQTETGYHPNHIICDIMIYQRILAFIDLCLYSVVPSILILIFNILITITMFHAIKQRRNYLQANTYTPTTDISQRNKHKSPSTIRTQFFRSRSAESTPAGRSCSQFNKQRISHSPINNKYSEQKAISDSTSSTGIRLTCLLLTISFVFILCTLPISIRSLIADYLPSLKSTKRWHVTQLCLTLLMYFNHTINFVLYCLTGRTFRSECRKVLYNFCFFKHIQISCTTNPDSGKHHQQLLLIDRNRYIHPQRQQQQQYHPTIKGVYL